MDEIKGLAKGDLVVVVGWYADGQYGTLVRRDKTAHGEPGWLVKLDDRFSGLTIPTKNLRRA